MKLSLRKMVIHTVVLAVIGAVYCGGASRVAAQVSPNEILNPALSGLEKDNFPQLKTINKAIAKEQFRFPFYLSRFVGLDPAQQVEADTRGLEFVRFKDRVVLKATGNYNAAYSSKQFTRNERASRTFRDVMLPILMLTTQTISPEVECDSIGFEVAYHVREREKAYDYEGKEILVVVLDRNDAFQMAQVTNDMERQEILNRSLIYVNGEEYGLSLLDKDPTAVDAFARAKGAKAQASSGAGAASSSAARLIHSSPYLQNASMVSTGTPKQDLSQAKPAATEKDAERLETQYKEQLEALAKEGESKFQFVNYDPPAFIVVSKQMGLQMTMKNSQRFDPEKASLYKRAAQTFDLFLAPKMKDVLEKAPNDTAVDVYVFSIVNPLAAVGKERSEAMDFVMPKTVAQQFANAEITNQQAIDKSQVLVNGVRIGLSLQMVE
jgi:hypothetical protein